MITLCEVHTDFFQFRQNCRTLDKLGDGFETHDMANIVDRRDHGKIDVIRMDVPHETAIDLQVLHRQILQIRKGT